MSGGPPQRVNDCGCIETWIPMLVCEEEPQLTSWTYWLTTVCEEHAEGHRRFLDNLRREIDNLDG